MNRFYPTLLDRGVLAKPDPSSKDRRWKGDGFSPSVKKPKVITKSEKGREVDKSNNEGDQ